MGYLAHSAFGIIPLDNDFITNRRRFVGLTVSAQTPWMSDKSFINVYKSSSAMIVS